MANLPLDGIVDVKISIGPVNKVRSNFDLGLVIGKSTHISTEDRIKIYSSLESMKIDGFLETDPEYIAANIYFSQSPSPSRVAIGRRGTDETATEAISQCRNKNTEWYGATLCDATDSEIEEVAKYIESCKLKSLFFYTTNSADVLTGTKGNIAEKLKTAGYGRTHGIYSTTSYAVASPMAYVMAHSEKSFDIAYKSMPGITVEDIQEQQTTLFKNNYINYFVNRGNSYNLYEMGTMSNGTFIDEVVQLDMLQEQIQSAILNVMTSDDKTPQTDDGVEVYNTAITGVLDKFVESKFISPGIWTGTTILGIKTGTMLAKGYLILNSSISDQTQADREQRKAPDTYVLLKLAGSIQHLSVGVYVNR
nr:MAG TPA: tail sheath protein [Caudoviricetes sp.]